MLANPTGYGSLYAPNPSGAAPAMVQRRYRQLPINVPLLEWNVDSVYGAISAHENGVFTQSSYLHDAMMRDDRYAGCMQTRVQTATGKERLVKLSEKSDAEEARVALTDEAPKMITRSSRAQLREWTVGLGFAIGQIVKVYDEAVERWHWTVEPWHPQYVYYRLDSDSYQLISYEGIIDIGHGIPGQFVVYEPMGKRSWMNGALRSLGLNWLGRNFAMNRDWPRLLELYALGIRKAIVPPLADEKKKKAFLRAVNGLGAETTIVVEQGTEPGDPKFDLEIEAPPVANNGRAFDMYVERVENNIAIRLLGVNLTTKASAKSSSGAAAEAQSDIQGTIVAADLAGDSDSENEFVFRPWTADHFGPVTADAITSEYVTEKDETQADRIDAVAKLAPALPMLEAAGVDVGEFLRELEIPMAMGATAKPALPAPVAPGTPQPADPNAPPQAEPSALSRGDSAHGFIGVNLARTTPKRPVNPRLVRHATQAQALLDHWHADGLAAAAAAPQAFARQIVAECQNVIGFDKLATALLDLYRQRKVQRDLVDAVHAARLRARLLGRLAVIREGGSNGPTERSKHGRVRAHLR